MGQTRPLFVYFRPFRNTNIVQLTIMEKALMVCLGFEPQDRRMEGADESTELCAVPSLIICKFGFNL